MTLLRVGLTQRLWLRFPCKAIGLERNGRKPGPGVVAVTVEGTEHRVSWGVCCGRAHTLAPREGHCSPKFQEVPG